MARTIQPVGLSLLNLHDLISQICMQRSYGSEVYL